MNIITGYRGEPHITSAQDRAENQGTFGEGSYVLDVGSKLEATAVSATEIRIADGVISHQGCLAIIENGTYDTLAISNGSQGVKRIDLIVARYSKDADTSVESMSLVVIEGTPSSSTPTAPSYNEGDIQDGDSPVDMPLYQVKLDGITLDSVTAVFDTVKTQKETDAALATFDSALDSVTFTRSLLTANTSKSYHLPNNYRGVLFTIGSSSNVNGCYIVYTTAQGAVTMITVLAASGITFTTSTANTITMLSTAAPRVVFLNAAPSKATEA